MVENLDWNVGRIVDYLKTKNIEDNTIVMYMTDNGPNGIRWNDGMKGRKGSTDEGGVRSPLFIKWHNTLTPGLKIKEISGAIDLAPTLSELCGLELRNDKSFDGISLAPLILEKEVSHNERKLVHHWRGRTSIRSQRYKLDHEDKLYDMFTDSNQKIDVSSEQEEMHQELLTVKAKWLNDVASELSKVDNRPFPIGYQLNVVDHLPARDGVSHGNIKRSNRYPNDSYFYNWISLSDSITWNTEIMEPGNYEIAIHYTCAPDQIGSEIKINFGSRSIRHKVQGAHDPPLIGASEDRVVRIESYVKEFKQVWIGNISLSRGKVPLSIKAKSIANKSVMEINRISFKRIE